MATLSNCLLFNRVLSFAGGSLAVLLGKIQTAHCRVFYHITSSYPPMLSVNTFITIAQYYFPGTMSLFHLLTVFQTFLASMPLYRNHPIQMEHGQRRVQSAWLKAVQSLLKKTILDTSFYRPGMELLGPGEDDGEAFIGNVEDIIQSMKLDEGLQEDGREDLRGIFEGSQILCAEQTECLFCTHNGKPVGLRMREKIKLIYLITESHSRVEVNLVVSHCVECKANYYPDSVTRRAKDDRPRKKYALNEAKYLHISKPGRLWVYHNLGKAQAQAILQHTTYLGFATWFNRSFGGTQANSPSLTPQQSQRLFAEHMIRVLGEANGGQHLSTRPNPNLKDIVMAACGKFVKNGVLPNALEHTCRECTHPKRYRNNGEQLSTTQETFAVAEVDGEALEFNEFDIVSNLPFLRNGPKS